MLSLNQRELAELVGISRSTVQRLHAGRARLSGMEMATLARAAYPKDEALAERVAAASGTTLEALGLRAPPPAPRPPPPAKPPSPHIAESVLCAAAEAMNLPPQAVRAALRAAFVRARDLGLTVEMVAAAFDRSEGA